MSTTKEERIQELMLKVNSIPVLKPGQKSSFDFESTNSRKAALVQELKTLQEAATIFCKGYTKVDFNGFTFEGERPSRFRTGYTVHIKAPYSIRGVYSYQELIEKIKSYKKQISELDRRSSRLYLEKKKTEENPIQEISYQIQELESKLRALKEVKELMSLEG